MTNIYCSLNQAIYESCKDVLANGERVQSRNGSCIELENHEFILNSPKNRHLHLNGRKNNIYATIAETFWVLARKAELDPVMNFFLPRAVQFSDDGKSWRGNYGERIYRHHQIDHVVNMFLQDGINTRRATLAIWQPELDTTHSMKYQGIEKTKDLPCSNYIWYWVRDGYLNCKLAMRSNDLIWGCSAINVFEFTFLQEIIVKLLNNNGLDVKLGSYFHNAISFHLYSPGTADQARDIVNDSANKFKFENKLCNELLIDNHDLSLGQVKDENKLWILFNNIYSNLCNAINDSEIEVTLEDIFDNYRIPTENNSLYAYSILAYNYALHKRGKLRNSEEVFLNDVLPYLSVDLKHCVAKNHFTPEEWKKLC